MITNKRVTEDFPNNLAKCNAERSKQGSLITKIYTRRSASTTQKEPLSSEMAFACHSNSCKFLKSVSVVVSK